MALEHDPETLARGARAGPFAADAAALPRIGATDPSLAIVAVARKARAPAPALA